MNFSKAHFIGIAGKGMSATALLLRQMGVQITGSDEGFYPPVSDYLKNENIPFAALMPLVKEGFAKSLTEAATRFARSHPAMGTILVGMATPQQFEDALAAVEKGPLPQAALDRLATLRQAFSGEPR